MRVQIEFLAAKFKILSYIQKYKRKTGKKKTLLPAPDPSLSGCEILYMSWNLSFLVYKHYVYPPLSFVICISVHSKIK